jgi:hypothetical protein
LTVEGFHDDTDFFNIGVDSLKTSQIANSLQATLKAHLDRGVNISTRLPFENPNIGSLAVRLYLCINHMITNGHKGIDEDKRVAQMRDMVEIYSNDTPSSMENVRKRMRGEKANVILTGSTGSLGSYILGRLLIDPAVGNIYCLDLSEDAQTRFVNRRKALREGPREFPASKVHWFKVELVGASYVRAIKYFFNELIENVDVIVQNAWKVSALAQSQELLIDSSKSWILTTPSHLSPAKSTACKI